MDKTWFQQAVDDAGGMKVVAEKSGLSQSHLKNLYRHVRPLTVDSVNALEPVLGVTSEVWQAALKAKPPRKPRRKAAPTVTVEGATDAA